MCKHMSVDSHPRWKLWSALRLADGRSLAHMRLGQFIRGPLKICLCPRSRRLVECDDHVLPPCSKRYRFVSEQILSGFASLVISNSWCASHIIHAYDFFTFQLRYKVHVMMMTTTTMMVRRVILVHHYCCCSCSSSSSFYICPRSICCQWAQ